MKTRTYILIILLALLTAGCHNRPIDITATDSITHLTPDFKYLQSTFTCTIFNHNANGQIRMQSDSLIWVSLNKFIELGRLQLTTDTITLYTKFNNSYYKGTYPEVEQQFDFHTNYYSLQDLIITAVQSDSTTFTLPVRSNVINTDIRIQLNKIKYPEQLTFPLRIPNSAQPWKIPEI